jgi:predicted nucleotidyltransferase
MLRRAEVSAAIDAVVQRIARDFSPERIILFGSHARGDAREDSDIDLLVLFRDVDDPRARAAEVYAALIGCSELPKDIVVSTTARFERYRNVANTVYWPAAREGKVMYDRAA